jgi:hypothetical protein
MRLLSGAQDAGDMRLCRELLRFLRAADDTGAALKEVVEKAGLVSVSAKEEVAG